MNQPIALLRKKPYLTLFFILLGFLSIAAFSFLPAMYANETDILIKAKWYAAYAFSGLSLIFALLLAPAVVGVSLWKHFARQGRVILTSITVLIYICIACWGLEVVLFLAIVLGNDAFSWPEKLQEFSNPIGTTKAVLYRSPRLNAVFPGHPEYVIAIEAHNTPRKILYESFYWKKFDKSGPQPCEAQPKIRWLNKYTLSIQQPNTRLYANTWLHKHTSHFDGESMKHLDMPQVTKLSVTFMNRISSLYVSLPVIIRCGSPLTLMLPKY